MKIEFLKLINFRNYDRLEVKFHPVLNLIYGKNGSGKTNLVEAIYVLGLTRSFRPVSDKALIAKEKSVSRIQGVIRKKTTTDYQLLLSKDGKKVKINNNKVSKLSDYISKIPIVLFHPDDLRFIKDTPSTRRKTLNISISLTNIEYLRILNDYRTILKQRNAYLKQMMVNGNKSSHYLDILTEKLVDAGIKIHMARKNYLEKLNPYLEFYYEKITGFRHFGISYYSDYNELDKEHILHLYRNSLVKDISFGKTNIGVHTDDIKFVLDGQDLRDYGSEGQQKNAIIAYKFGELEILKKQTGNSPIFILDDLFSELDQEKVNHILNLLQNDIQTFITTTDLVQFSVLDDFNYKKFWIHDGKIVEENVHER